MLKILLRYLFFCIAGTVGCSIIFLIYGLCQSHVAGEKLSSFSFQIFVFGLRKYAPVVMECSVVFLALHLVNRWNCKVLPIVMYVVLGLGTWFGLCPLMEMFVVPANSSLEQKMDGVHASAGFFRRVGDGVVYYFSVDEAGVGDGVLIDLKGSDRKVFSFERVLADATGEDLSGEELSGLEKSGASAARIWNKINSDVKDSKFRDSLVEEQVPMPYVVERGLVGIEAFCVVQKRVAGQGWIAWLWFATAGVALISCAGLMNASRWKLLNGCLVVIFSVFVLVMNTFFYLPASIFAGGVEWVNNLLKFASFMRNQTAVLFNLILAVTMTLLGIIFDIRAAKEAEEEAA